MTAEYDLSIAELLNLFYTMSQQDHMYLNHNVFQRCSLTNKAE